MKLSGSQPAWRRRSFVSLGVAAMVACAASGLRAQQTTGQTTGQAAGQPQGQAQAPAGPDQFKLSSDAAMFLNFIKPEKAADFEEVWKTIRTKLSASDKPELKAFGDGLKIYKVDTPPVAPQGLVYILFADPNPKTTFDPGKILYESGLFERADADALYGKLKETYNNIQPWPLISMNK
jgi:hypothetical protein